MNEFAYLNMIKQELQQRIDKNQRYSLRRFASQMGVDQGALSNILNGKRLMPLAMGEKILQHLSLSQERADLFRTSLIEHQKLHKAGQLGGLGVDNLQLQMDLIDQDIFKVIGDWYHYAILELSQTEDFRPHYNWISAQLGISAIETKLAVERLIKLGLLEEKDRTYKKTKNHISIKDKTNTSTYLKKLQKDVLLKAIDSLENDPIEIRNMSSITTPIDPDKIPLAKKLIEEFSLQLCNFLSKNNKKVVYHFNIGLYPVQRRQT